ncbi:hypothetical protein SAMN02910418_00343 [Bowdeniella nasicola]|uniref:SPOR domain-containing protein n=1 Tax=Bowdeniella nasicola TaxID=208480 RepID=A0A1H3WB39_9ACTO|nr:MULTISPECIES: hypothetical protein [Bowdeniella]SDZ83644.1 hypothetical protein SAMN02910418_00343 [Bowdeniella nasicola]
MAAEYYYVIATGEVEEGRQSGASGRMGPYPTREAAEHAMQIAKERNEKWEEEDREWNEED